MKIMEEIVGVSLAKLKGNPTALKFEKGFKRGISEILEKHGFVDVPRGMVERYFRAIYWELFCGGGDLARHVQAEEYGEGNRVELMRAYRGKDIKALSVVVLGKYGSGVSNYLGRD